MGLGEFWSTTPGEIALYIAAAEERRLDELEIAIIGYAKGRVLAYGKLAPAEVLPARRGRRASGGCKVDAVYTAHETAKWAKHPRGPHGDLLFDAVPARGAAEKVTNGG